jgi:preprotein translocase subunit SecG
MSFVIGFLTVILVLNCLLLILLVLIQLPKKETGAGIAFGGAATDALFGAGSGNVLTKVTKYATVVFFALAIVVSIMQSKLYHGRGLSEFEQDYSQQNSQSPVHPVPQASTPLTAPAALPGASETPQVSPSAPVDSTPVTGATNAN